MVNHASEKDHSVNEGSVKGKPSNSQRNKEQVLPESVESALPASAHWLDYFIVLLFFCCCCCFFFFFFFLGGGGGAG